jgi:uncharacterized membrane protein HdeD (DUF308 family)
MVVIVGDWRAYVVRGVVALLFGIATLIWPDITLWVLVLLFGIYVLMDGIMVLWAVITRAPSTRDQRGWLIFHGIVSVGAGIITLVWPDITALALLFLIAAWAALSGIMQIALAVHLRKEIKNEWLLYLSGGLAIAFALLLVITPGAGALVITWLIAWFAILYGIVLVLLALRMRKLEQEGGTLAPPARPATT